MRIDLHTHSTASDGTDRPAALVHAAAEAELDVVALTDHDTFAGLPDAEVAGQELGVDVVPGVEISCAIDGISLHLLGYWCDPKHADLAAELSLNRDDRVPRAQEIVRRLADAGHPVTWSDVEAEVTAGATVGRPHIADALVTLGLVPDRDAAFADLLHNDSPFYATHHATDPVEAIRLVRAAGGVAVFAHPGAGRRGRLVSDQVVEFLAAAGLSALEVDHPDHDEEARAHYRRLAGSLELLVTGSSDYHGTGKLQGIGACTTDPDVFSELSSRAAPTGSRG
jgi:3',5'-nucleoside bisphosphate phosphatase